MAFPPYSFNSSQIGLMSLPPFIGTSLGVLVTGPLSDWIILFLARRNQGIYEPEMRLWAIAGFIPLVPAGILTFGLGLSRGTPWPVLAAGFALCAFGNAPASSVSLTYITDAYGEVCNQSSLSMKYKSVTKLIWQIVCRLIGWGEFRPQSFRNCFGVFPFAMDRGGWPGKCLCDNCSFDDYHFTWHIWVYYSR
jgi:MFS family permease